MRKHLVIGIAAMGLLAGPALAQTTPPSFATADSDTSASVSLAEAMAIWPDITQDAFTSADTNMDGALDQTEYDTYVAGLPAAQ
jgi:hypothetical protein